MSLTVPDEFKKLCRKIVEKKQSVAEWARIESDDMFQTPNFTGGFDATENAFCFSYYDPSRSEFWFQVTLDEVNSIAVGHITTVDIRPAE